MESASYTLQNVASPKFRLVSLLISPTAKSKVIIAGIAFHRE